MAEAILLAVVSILCMAVGLFIYFKPILAIEIQKKFYEKINWKMEPISLTKEIRNTKLMGFFLVVFVIAALVCSLCVRF